MDVDLKRLSGTASATEKPRLDTLRFTVAPNSFFTIVHPSWTPDDPQYTCEVKMDAGPFTRIAARFPVCWTSRTGRWLDYHYPAGVSLSDINDAVDAINTGFDQCRTLVTCPL